MTTEDNIIEEVKAVVAQADSPHIVDAITDEVLRVHLDVFQGPFEVLLYLIKVQEIDIFDIPILKITEQFLRFLDMMQQEDLDVTADFLVLAATLIQIKSKMLLPAHMDTDDDEEIDEGDPRLELVEKLLEYRRYRDIMDRLRILEEARENWFARSAKPKIEKSNEEEFLEVTLYDLTRAFRGVLRFFDDSTIHNVDLEGSSVDDKIDLIMARLKEEGSLSWTDLLKECRSRLELVCCFLAILELCRMDRLRARQQHAFDEIRLFHHEEKPVNVDAPVSQTT